MTGPPNRSAAMAGAGLTSIEVDIYSALRLNPGELVSYGRIWLDCDPKVGRKMLNVHVSNLRSKLPPEEAAKVRTGRGGYYYGAPDDGPPRSRAGMRRWLRLHPECVVDLLDTTS